MRIYVAAPWKHRDDANVAAKQLRDANHVVISRWLRDHADSTNHVQLQREAMNDLHDLSQCEGLIYLNLAKSEGKATELGFALAMQKRIILVGERENNVFLHLPQIYQVPTVHDAIRLLPHI